MQNGPREKNFVERHKPLLLCLLLAAGVFLVYVQVVSHEFISYDDGIYVTNNPLVKAGLSMDTVRKAFSLEGLSERTYYHPVTWLSHLLDIQAFGLNPGMHHLTSVVIHVLNAALLFALLYTATGSLPASLVAAALFGLHPVNVDSVAWLAERKNLLSALFWMLGLLAYVRYVRKKSLAKYLAVVASFALGLLAKPSIVAFPCVLVLMDFWPLKRIVIGKEDSGLLRFKEQWKLLAAEKVPLLALSFASVYVSSLSLDNLTVPTSLVPMSLRLENAVVACVKYLWKMALPFDLTFFYPYPVSVPAWKVTGAAIVLISITSLAIWWVRRRTYFLFGWLWYLGTIFPVLGIMQGGQWPEIAERWAYIPLIGIYVVIAWGTLEVIERLSGTMLGKPAAAVPVVVTACLVVLTWNQAGYWKDDFTLYTHGVTVNPDNFVAQNNLGNALLEMGRVDEAVARYMKAITISPGFPEPHYNLGVIYLRKSDPYKAIWYLKRSLELNPDDADSYLSLGVARIASGNLDEALRYLGIAESLDPDNPQIPFNLGLAFYRKGDLKEAFKHYEMALQIDPGYAEAHYNLGVIYVVRKDLPRAIEEFSNAVALDPRHKEAHYNLGRALFGAGRRDEARKHYQEALRIDPGFTPAKQQLMTGSDRRVGIENAIQAMEKTLEIDPGNIAVLNRLAVYYSFLGKNDQALSTLERITRISPDSADALYNIACIHAKENRIMESVKALQKAVGLGFKNWQLLKTDRDLDNIRSTNYYTDLISRVDQ